MGLELKPVRRRKESGYSRQRGLARGKEAKVVDVGHLGKQEKEIGEWGWRG